MFTENRQKRVNFEFHMFFKCLVGLPTKTSSMGMGKGEGNYVILIIAGEGLGSQKVDDLILWSHNIIASIFIR